MEQYKLIKEYLGGPALGTVLEALDKAKYMYSKGKFSPFILKSQVINSPEYWKKISKPYSIKSYTSKLPNDIIIDATDIRSLKDREVNIHSIIRLSDNAVFTVKDEVEFHLPYNERTIQRGTITAFISTEKGDLIIHTTRISSNNWVYNYKHTNISDLIKLNTPTYVTADSVVLKEGDEVYGAFSNCVTFNRITFKNVTKEMPFDTYTDNQVYFATKENAIEHLVDSCACLSLNEIKSVWSGFGREDIPLSVKLNEQVKDIVRKKIIILDRDKR